MVECLPVGFLGSLGAPRLLASDWPIDKRLCYSGAYDIDYFWLIIADTFYEIDVVAGRAID